MPFQLVYTNLKSALAEAEPRAELRAALVALWRVQHAGQAGCGPALTGPQARLAVQVQVGICQQWEAQWSASYARVAAVLSAVVRASSVVECMNSVVRMHQARHRGMTQGLLDLKRVYWNCQEFGEGKRRGHSPYEHLGLSLPTYAAWELLRIEPEQLAQGLGVDLAELAEKVSTTKGL